MNSFYTPTVRPKRTTETLQAGLGGIQRTNAIVRRAQDKKRVEELFMSFAYNLQKKENRAQDQRNERREKRNK